MFKELFQFKFNKIIPVIILVIVCAFLTTFFQALSLIFIKTGGLSSEYETIGILIKLLSIFLICPFVEELGKLKAIHDDMIGTYLIIFNIVEFISYIPIAHATNISIPVFIFLRIFPVIMHYCTAQNILVGYKKYKETNDKNYVKKYFKISVMLHSFFNIIVSGL